MRVLHLLKTAHGATWALRQTTELVKLGYEVHVALPDGPMVERYQAAGVQTHILNPSVALARPWQNISLARALRQRVLQIKPDIVHSHFVATTLLMRAALVGVDIPRIFHIPGPLHLEHPLYRAIDIRSASKADFYLASCKWTEHALARFGVPVQRIGLAYYGVNEQDFARPSDKVCGIRRAFEDCDMPYVIGMVAWFYGPKRCLGQTRGLKGHEDLIDAVALLKDSHPFIRLVIVGGPWAKADRYYENVKRYAVDKLGKRVLFTGPRSDVPDLYRQFDLAVHPSHSENVGGAVESMYARVPTLTTNVGGFPDLVVPGETGYMAEAKNPASLATQIAQAIADRHTSHEMTQRAYDKVSSVMNVANNAQEVAAFYERIFDDREACDAQTVC